jgi:hypothetical protein
MLLSAAETKRGVAAVYGSGNDGLSGSPANSSVDNQYYVVRPVAFVYV